ncbi:MAG: NAD(+) diphosphatase [Actinobacteria bacterium]|nr:NAD(+) diphosphatase [Actinomycetota bacterium]
MREPSDSIRRFIPGLVIERDLDDADYVLAVHGARLLVIEGEPARLPRFGEARVEGARHYLGALDGIACWSIVLAEESPAPPGMTFAPLRPLHALVEEDVFPVAGRAVQIAEWHETHRFCGRCGLPTEDAPGERAKRCPGCGLHAYPRVAPAVIVRVTRGDRILLARGTRFPEAIYSILAGFVDPGESLEECVVREVREEVGIELRDVRYWASQPWPFPHSLMLGFTAEHAAGEIVIDEAELVDAQWFSVDDLPTLPGGISIARRLIDDWLTGH